MDPITTAIIAAVAAGVTKTGEKAVVDTYNGLKKLIERKFGKRSDLPGAIAKVEAKPDSKPRKAVLEEEIADSGAAEDPEVQQAAADLTRAIESTARGRQIVKNVRISGGGAAAIGNGAVAVGKGGVNISGSVGGSVNTGSLTPSGKGKP